MNIVRNIRDKCRRNKNKDYNHYMCEQKLINYECIICLNEFDHGQSLTLLKCEHIYHKHCLELWFDRKRTCPLCDILIKP
jgi:hypothetical protein